MGRCRRRVRLRRRDGLHPSQAPLAEAEDHIAGRRTLDRIVVDAVARRTRVSLRSSRRSRRTTGRRASGAGPVRPHGGRRRYVALGRSKRLACEHTIRGTQETANPAPMSPCRKPSWRTGAASLPRYGRGVADYREATGSSPTRTVPSGCNPTTPMTCVSQNALRSFAEL